MISHKNVSERHSIDELDGLMCWALRERVAGASPPPRAWECIRARAEWHESWMLVGCKFSQGYRVVMSPLSKLDAFLSAQYAAWKCPQPHNAWVEWRHNPWLTHLLDQYSSMLRFAC